MDKSETAFVYMVYDTVTDDDYDESHKKYVAAFTTPEAAWGMANSLGLEVEDIPLDTYGEYAACAEEIKNGNSLYRVGIYKNQLRRPSVAYYAQSTFFLNKVSSYRDYYYVTVWAQDRTAAIDAAKILVDEQKDSNPWTLGRLMSKEDD